VNKKNSPTKEITQNKTPDMSVAEFKERIKGICGIRPANELVTRCNHATKLNGRCVKCGEYPYDKPRRPHEVRGSAASNACFGAL
jgi:hypothetical protein